MVVLVVAVLGCFSRNTDLNLDLTSGEQVARGRYLAKSMAACGFCHGESAYPDAPLSGGALFYDKFGGVHAANITPDRSGLNEYTVKELVRVIRAGIDRNDDLISPQAHDGFQWMADEDVLSIISYLRTLPAVSNAVEKREVGFVSKNTTGLFDKRREVRGFIARVSEKETLEHGKYLVDHVARCGSCHNSSTAIFGSEKYLGGGRAIRRDSGEKVAPALNFADYLRGASWTENDILNYLKTGVTPNQVTVDPHFCPVEFYKRAAEGDLTAMAKYLKSLTP